VSAIKRKAAVKAVCPARAEPVKPSRFGLCLFSALGGDGLIVELDNGTQLHLEIEGPTGEALAELIRRQLARLGMAVAAKPRQTPALLDARAPVRRFNEAGKPEGKPELSLEDLL
jgi:hypothetical protein